MSKRGRYLVKLAMECKIETFNDNQNAYGETNNSIEKYGDATDRKMIPVEMGQSNEIIDENATNKTNSKKPVSLKVFTELQPLREGNATDRKMIPVEMRQSNEIIDEIATNETNKMRQSNEIIDEIATNETNSKKPVLPKVFTELQPLCECNATDRKIIPVEMRQSNEIIDENATNETNCEKPVLPKVFTELQPLREEYLKDSPVNDFDVDPDYEPSDEEQKNTKKIDISSPKKKNFNFGERRQYLNANVKNNIVQQRRTGCNNKRQWSLTYSMIKVNEGTEKKVCKNMFLYTHGLKTDGMITELKRHQNKSKGLQIAKDGKEKGSPPNKTDGLIFKDHIHSFNPQVSHYKFVHAPNRRYLSSDISITDMWKDFCETIENVSYGKYRHEVYLENIGFNQPNQDDCNVCINMQNAPPTPTTNANNLEEEEEEEEQVFTKKNGEPKKNIVEKKKVDTKPDRIAPCTPKNSGNKTASPNQKFKETRLTRNKNPLKSNP
ncbi:unnamed protein product [Psylliodes chrysocephalus]|uniref:Uncharacterized protein n=1 Tax=Psylliodes chrysocephalus TaxID=3402493 RepID=A0A9P0D170_9CUCU|nr:unnamed protein product [Psylliodes chrysocephala]